jgi:hypothetical protein
MPEIYFCPLRKPFFPSSYNKAIYSLRENVSACGGEFPLVLRFILLWTPAWVYSLDG